ncbi:MULTISPECIES: mechanosensitive ion channel domain-containing protein [unclassified Spirosoma]|uniref:mechanosensitive ion channel family protein n=1 Tax=unclassified Spirosoma TaxID=2621999 RepID=UPI000ACAAF6F|nr:MULTISPECIES: mechanosensitive ion channel domain-containing protein [unclassified Spirosoma]
MSRLILVSLCITISGSILSAQDTTQTQETTPVQTIPDTLLFKIQRAQSIITEIRSTNKKGYGIARIRAGLADVKANIAPISADLRNHRKIVDAKSLANYSLILNDALERLRGWRTALAKSNNDLQSQLDQVLGLSGDSLLIVAAHDSTEKKLYVGQLTDIRLQLQEAGTRTTARLDTVSRLLADVSGTYLNASNLQGSISDRWQKSNENALLKESPYLWDAPATFTIGNVQSILKSSYQGQDKILKYFFASTWDNRFLLLLLTGLFFAWVFTNYKKANTALMEPKIGPIQFDNLMPVPIVASLIVLLNLTPLFEPESPAIYIEITQFLLLVVLTIHLWKRFSKHDLSMWLLNAGLYVLLLITNTLISDTLFMRLWLIVLNAAFFYIGIVFSRRLHRRYLSERMIRPVVKLYLVLQGLAVLLNILGRISLAKLFSITGVIGLVQITGLGVFIEVVLEALELQIKLSACSGGVFSRVNVNHTQRSFKKGLVVLAIGVWLLVFFINLGVADSIYNFFSHILTRPRTFGSITFTLSSVLSFALIIYLSSLLQRNIGLFFGESKLPSSDGQVDQVSSVLALTRLVVVIAGVLLAFAASGLSVDKLTVVLGALSVGIGLGMQNIVSNFVSGIILIFEKPFQIGDYIEIADKKGRIRDIGIRSSKMITVQGSEVVIPNGDLLSNRLVNWTSSDTYLKTEFMLKVNLETDLKAVNDIVTKAVSQQDGTIQNRPPEVLVTGVGGDSVELTIRVWIKSIYSEADVKSKLLQQLIRQFKESEIKLM